ncbi:circadian clock-controlled protein daywake-like isoform X1 [Pieris napi]|uniref:circadian clock-controlled protein daywake-like isoform X1 n=1 Tax=Pieris napi TaxID=78633 RepID=UPI001FBA7990|nr:circadian clock-controlled protein daywake-like isoform X1 [Pieris napi]
MISIFEILALTTLCASVAQSELLAPCHINDDVCLKESVNKALPQFFSENKTLGVESSDPLKLELIEGDLPDIKFKFFSPITTGFKQCHIKNMIMNLDALTLHEELDCPNLETTGKYEISGRLMNVPIEGNGDFKISAGTYKIILDFDLETVVGGDNKAYISMKSFKQKNEATSPISFDFKNLFNGKKDLADNALTFANQNWKQVSELLQDPIWNNNMKKIISNANKYLMTEPLDQIFISP